MVMPSVSSLKKRVSSSMRSRCVRGCGGKKAASRTARARRRRQRGCASVPGRLASVVILLPWRSSLKERAESIGRIVCRELLARAGGRGGDRIVQGMNMSTVPSTTTPPPGVMLYFSREPPHNSNIYYICALSSCPRRRSSACASCGRRATRVPHLHLPSPSARECTLSASCGRRRSCRRASPSSICCRSTSRCSS